MPATETAVKLLKNVTSTMCNGTVSNVVLSGFSSLPIEQIPGMDTKEVMKYIKMYELDNPASMLKFLIELHFTEIESFQDSINSVRNDLLSKTVSKIKSVRSMLRNAENNPEERADIYKECKGKLSDVKSDLEDGIRNFISDVEKFDNRTGFDFFIHSFDLKKATDSAKLASVAMEAYMQLPLLFSLLGEYSGSDNSNFLEEYSEFIQELQDKQRISLMTVYDKKSERIWNSEKLKSELDSARRQADTFSDIKKEYDLENDVDFS